MTSKQKRIIVVLALVNGVIILALVMLVTRPSSIRYNLSPGPSPRDTLPLSTAASGTLPQGACQWDATQLLAQAGLGGTVTLTSDGASDHGILRFEIAYRLMQDQAAVEAEQIDEAAQLVWAAFDVALAMNEKACDSFTQVEVSIIGQSGQTSLSSVEPNNETEVPTSWQISASVSTADLVAFGANELSEDEFIQRVTYTVVNQ
jgi:hypothetical protein